MRPPDLLGWVERQRCRGHLGIVVVLVMGAAEWLSPARHSADVGLDGDVTSALGIAAVSLVSGLLLQSILVPWLRRRGVVDIPNHRSSHAIVTPRGGGIAVLIALGIGLLTGRADTQVWAIYAGAVLLGLVGLVDDLDGLDARLRLGAVLLVGGAAGAVIDTPAPALVALTLMAFWSAAYVNAFNFMDGINGISALSAMVAGVTYTAAGLAYHSGTLAAIGAALFGSCLSFLPYNMPRARVFLGDTGSYGVGFAIAGCAWLAWADGVPLLIALSPTLVYLADTGWTLVLRAKAGAPIMEAHRGHVYQQLAANGRSHSHVAALVSTTSLGIVLLAWVGTQQGIAGTALTVLVIAVVGAGYLWTPRMVDRKLSEGETQEPPV